ncbi:competence protein ComFC [Marininema mesophilum]|uniref:Competence protein ComFC n=1 Tax=Marininema mesophilum TaxID=1048340 RepID=A0A1H2TIM2_9BACL|nr:ComF family protein [Marininema mesophilum]SDW43650.1 competence protein ComFC [Marininema mesophilum]
MMGWWETFFPTPTCCLCGSPYRAPGWAPIWKRICSPCIERLFPIRGEVCPRCGRPQSIRGHCSDCQRMVQTFLEANRSSLSYRSYTRESIHLFKFRGKVSLATPFAEMMTLTLVQAKWHIDRITYVPLHATRLTERGFNQAELLARLVARRLRIPLVHCLERRVVTPFQSHQGRRARQQTLIDAFVLKSGLERDVADKCWLLVDDVYTTGATLQECASLLKKAGATKVYSLTLAR